MAAKHDEPNSERLAPPWQPPDSVTDPWPGVVGECCLPTELPPRVIAAFREAADGLASPPRVAKEDLIHDHSYNPVYAASYGRMQAVFEWLVCKFVTLAADLEQYHVSGATADYATTLRDYNELLGQLAGRGRSATYSFAGVFKQFTVIPSIRGGRLRGVQVIGEWNPHSSSSYVHS